MPAQYERTRVTGTRILKFATHFPCIVLCLVRRRARRRPPRGSRCDRRACVCGPQMPLLLRRLSFLDSQLKQRLQVRRYRLPCVRARPALRR